MRRLSRLMFSRIIGATSAMVAPSIRSCGQSRIAAEPKNTALQRRLRSEQAKRELGMPTLPSTIALEKATTPFLRVLEPDIVEAIRPALVLRTAPQTQFSKRCAV